MKRMRSTLAVVATIAMCASTVGAVDIEMVAVTDLPTLGNLSGAGAGGSGPDRTCGSVDYVYNIGMYEVTAGQYTEFLNAIAAADPNGLYDADMAGADGCQILQSGVSGSYTYSVAPDWADRPVNYVSWFDAIRFVNWLHNGQPTGAQSAATTEDGAYDTSLAYLDVVRKAGAQFFLPSEDEWYKAAYHIEGTPASYYDYPMSSSNPPSNDLVDPDYGNNGNFEQSGPTIGAPYYRTEVGEFENSASPYGTYDQGGNVREWIESVINGTGRGVRGGDYTSITNQLHAAGRVYSTTGAGSKRSGLRVAGYLETVCGDGVEEGWEECDDGNVVDGDGCSAACVVEFCGDGTVQSTLGEACDDGNNIDGDGCDADCVEEGACCDGMSCTMLTEADCDAASDAIYAGDDTDCADSPCDYGACCLGDASCVTHLTDVQCEAAGGIFNGWGTRCSCGYPTAAAVSRTGLLVLLTALMGLGAWTLRRPKVRCTG